MVTASPTPVDVVLERLDGVRRGRKGWSARCPHHEDRHASLAIVEGRDGNALVHCFGGCDIVDVVHEIGLVPPAISLPSAENLCAHG
ncbi:hypothetical protein BH20ACT21_BH20ACT21_25250 [soil metagenome]